MEEYMAYVWIGVAVFMAVIEMATTQLVSVWFVIGALCAAFTSLFTDSIVNQLVVFVGVSGIALIVTRPLVKRFKKTTEKVNTNADRLIGEIGVMRSDITDPEEVGQARVLGSVWSVRTGSPPLKKGDKVRVLSIEGVKLIVEKVQ